MTSIPVVHAVTDDEILLRDDFLEIAKAAMTALGPLGAVHIRSRLLGGRRLYEIGQWLAGWERDTGCWVIMNDRADVAIAAGLSAVQLTSRSFTAADVLRLDARLSVGASVHAANEARTAEAAGAHWCIAGTAFPTRTHPGEPAGGVKLMQEIAAAVTIPVIAIGGVTPAAAPQLAAAGIYGAATIRGVWNASDVGAAARDYLSAYGRPHSTQ